jgi:hypothetical protein
LPEVVLVRGARGQAGDCIVFGPLAFAGVGNLGDVGTATPCPLDRVLLFSPSSAVLLREVDWGGDQEILNFDAPPDLSGPINEVKGEPITVHASIWIATTGDDLTNRALDQFELANEIFATNRVGIRFEPREIDGVTGPFQIRSLVLPGSYDHCTKETLDGFFEDTEDGKGADGRYKGDLNVFYVSGGSGWRAETCPSNVENAEYGRIVYVNVGKDASTSLAHELGHALSLQWPLRGHTHSLNGTIGGFDSSNLMWSTDDDDAAEARIHVSLGQAVRMNVDETSWVNEGVRDPTLTNSPRIRDETEPTESCKCQDPYADTDTPCPKLSADIRSVPPGEPPFPVGVCTP